MPQGTTPASGSLKDPDVKTPEYQDRIGQLLDYVREIEAELSQLSSQVFKSGAVKDASQASTGETLQLRKSDGRGGDVADPSSNGDPVNLQYLAANFLKKSAFDPANGTTVWTGSSETVDMSALSDSGPGVYLVRASWSIPDLGALFVHDVLEDTQMVLDVTAFSGMETVHRVIRYTSELFTTKEQVYDYGDDSVTNLTTYIEEIIKL